MHPLAKPQSGHGRFMKQQHSDRDPKLLLNKQASAFSARQDMLFPQNLGDMLFRYGRFFLEFWGLGFRVMVGYKTCSSLNHTLRAQ